jgi:hypothetical protein
MWPERVTRSAGFWLVVALGAGVVGCDAALIGGALALVGTGAGILSAQCYDQVSVHVRDEQGRRTCDASVSITSDGSARSLRPCYHASLTEGHYRVSAQQAGYAAAEMEFAIPQHEGSCPHYTHTIELALRRPGTPAQPGFVHPKAPAPSEPARARPRTNLPAPIPVPPSAVPPAAVPPAAVPPAPAPSPAVPPAAPTPPPVPPAAAPSPAPVNPPAEPGPPSASFPPAAPAPAPAPAAP